MMSWGIQRWSQRRSLCLWLALALLLAVKQADASALCYWPAWNAFKAQMISAEGRVIDSSTERQQTVSEGQAYALFFALVADDRATFDKLLQWTENNLAQGDLTAHLPAWQWGHRDDGGWGVLDGNPASDADVWIAYVLGEAGRLWSERRYVVLSNIIANRILREETADVPGLGLTLLPAPSGFTPGKDRWRLNPSYVPVQALRRLAANDPGSVWPAVVASAQTLIVRSAPKGYSPDWTVFEAGKGFLPDADSQAVGSYNAIRVYLWAGLMDGSDPARATIVEALRPMAHYVSLHGEVPERVDTRDGAMQGTGPSGFVAAMIPFLNAAGDTQSAGTLRQRLAEHPVRADIYYGQALSLFSQGGADGPYRFAADGSLLPRWNSTCTPF